MTRFKTRWQTLIALAGMLWGGALRGEVGPDYQQPATETPARYKSAVVLSAGGLAQGRVVGNLRRQ